MECPFDGGGNIKIEKKCYALGQDGCDHLDRGWDIMQMEKICYAVNQSFFVVYIYKNWLTMPSIVKVATMYLQIKMQ